MSIINQLLNDLAKRNQNNFFKENELFKNLYPSMSKENFFAQYRLTFLLILLLTTLIISILVITQHQPIFEHKVLTLPPLQEISVGPRHEDQFLTHLKDVKIDTQNQFTSINLFFDELPSYSIKNEKTNDYQLLELNLDIVNIPSHFTFPRVMENSILNTVDTSFKKNVYQIIFNLKPDVEIKNLITTSKEIKLTFFHPNQDKENIFPGEMNIQNHEANSGKNTLNIFEQALEMNEQGNRKLAVNLLSNLLKNSPNHHQARQQLVNWLLEENQLIDAEKLIDEGLIIAVHHPIFIKMKARLLVERHDYTQAINLLNQSTPNINQDPDYYELKASILQQMHQTNLAIDTYNQLVQVMPENGNWWVGLAINLEENNQNNQAIQAYQQAINSELTKPELKTYAVTRIQQLKE